MIRIVRVLSILAFTLYMAGTPAVAEGEPGEFDYYTLVLSWSPTYCEEKRRDGDRNDPQCSARRPYAFVVHGFWPQYDRKRDGRNWPRECDIGRRPWVSNHVIDDMLDIMPSKRLVIHQYRAHGTCSGLDARDYFALTRKAYDAIRIPERFQRLDNYLTTTPAQIEREFLDANPALKPDMISVDCKSRRLRELRICFTRGLELRDCGPNEHQPRLCSTPKIVMPPVR
jgi:ribonuclease T2